MPTTGYLPIAGNSTGIAVLSTLVNQPVPMWSLQEPAAVYTLKPARGYRIIILTGHDIKNLIHWKDQPFCKMALIHNLSYPTS